MSHVDPRPVNVLSVCSGYGGLDLGIRLAIPTARTVCYVEREAYCCELLAQKMGLAERGSDMAALDLAPIWTDLRTFDGRAWRGVVDLVAGGIPCQPHSIAGKQLRGADERDLIDDFLRVVGDVGPSYVFVENVGGFAAWDGGGRLLAGLSALGLDAEWTAVRASDVGAPHRRERVFVLAHPHHEGQRQPRGTEPDERGRARDGGEAVGDPHRPRLEGRCMRGGRRAHERLAWPPSPADDWSGIPERLWPATTESVLRGVADGPPLRLDRLRALGNGVVPTQAAYALRHLLGRIP